MTDQTLIKKLSFDVRANRIDDQSSVAFCKKTSINLDTNLAGSTDAFNPAELLLAALSACIIKSIERITPILKFNIKKVEVKIHGIRQDVPPKMESINYTILIDSDESDHRLELLHENIKKFGTVYNTIAPNTLLTGSIIRMEK
jgi:uncharacterized OsmC-like protein